MGRAAAGVDVASVGRIGEHLDGGAEPAEDLGRSPVGRAVGAVEEHTAAAEIELLEAFMQLAHVVLERTVERAHAADPRRGSGLLLEACLDRPLGVVVELEAVGGEQLDAVVLIWIVGRGDDGREPEPMPAEQQRRRRRRQDAREQRVTARSRDPGGDRSLEHLAGLARIPHDQNLRVRIAPEFDRRPRQRQRQFGRQELPCASAHPIGAEEVARHRSRTTRRD